MVLSVDECANALYNANHRVLHVSTPMGFWPDLIQLGKRFWLGLQKEGPKSWGAYKWNKNTFHNEPRQC